MATIGGRFAGSRFNGGRFGERSGVSLAAIIAVLFGNGEQGFAYDLSDMSTLFQDRVGATPVTDYGQTVGMVLDKSQGLVLGPELVTNGTFDSDTAWTKGTGWTISGGVAVSTGLNQFEALSQNISTVLGKTYVISFSVIRTAGSLLMRVGGGTNFANINASGDYKYRVAAEGVGISFLQNAAGFEFAGSIDNISVRELPGHHATQSNAASRPVYGREPFGGRRNLLTYSEDFGNAAWVKRYTTGSAGTITATAAPGDHTINQPVTTSGATVAATLRVKAGTSNFAYLTLTPSFGLGNYATAIVNLSTGVISKTQNGGTLSGAVASILPADAGGFYTITMIAPNPTASMTVVVGISNSGTATINSYGAVDFAAAGTETVITNGVQLELGSTATPYQKVTSQWDVTEAGVPTVYYLQADGSDDFLVTPTITPGTDKAQVFAGVRKLSDAAEIILETSISIDGPNSGSLVVYNTSSRYGAKGVGSINPASIETSPAFTAPSTDVVTFIGDISGDLNTLRSNGSQEATSANDLGTGNFLAYPTYIFRRGGASLPFNGRLYGYPILRFGPNLDAATIDKVETLIAKGTGVTL